MPLTPGVNTYATEAQLAAYAEARGITVTGTPAVILTHAMDYLATLEDRWQGVRTLPTQPLAWPRTGVYVYGTELADDAIPQSLLDAQCRLALDADSGVELLPNVPVGGRGSVVREKVSEVKKITCEQDAADNCPVAAIAISK
jgi:ferredoxin